MTKIGDMLVREVQVQQTADLPSPEFYQFLEAHPDLCGLISAARRTGNLTLGMVNVHAVEVLTTKQTKIVEAAIELSSMVRFLAQWLVTAGKKFHFSVLEQTQLVVPASEIRDIKPPVTSKRRKTATPKTNGLPIPSVEFRKFVQKVGGGTADATKELQRLYYLLQSLQRVAEVIGEIYKVRVRKSTVANWVNTLHISAPTALMRKSRYRNIRPRMSLGLADDQLRVTKGIRMGLYEFTAQGLARKQSFTQIANEVATLTKVTILPFSLQRAAEIQGILPEGGQHGKR